MPVRLALDAVSHRYASEPVLRGIDLAVEDGELIALLGRSGSGKTTLLRLIAGLERLQTGAIAVAGRRLAGPGFSLAPEQRPVGVVFQDYALFPHLTAAENVGFGLTGRNRQSRAIELLARMGVGELAERYPQTLSGGQQQRVAIARALARKPQILLLDEPFSGLDVTLRAQVRDETRRLLRDTGATALIVTHDPEEAMGLADRIAVLEEGQLSQLGTPEALYADPATPYVAGLFELAGTVPGIGRGGGCQTDIGPIAIPAPEGRETALYLRPQALMLTDPGAGSFCATVRDVRPLGREAEVALMVDCTCVPGQVPLTARVPADTAPSIGQRIGIRLDPSAVHAFPVEAA